MNLFAVQAHSIDDEMNMQVLCIGMNCIHNLMLREYTLHQFV